jgi:hypothetical protein
MAPSYLDGTQLAEREPAKVFRDLAERLGVEIRTKRDRCGVLVLNPERGSRSNASSPGALSAIADKVRVASQPRVWRKKLLVL